jgi:phosphatidylglycerol:prolipoprotein diacylglycerol transferase
MSVAAGVLLSLFLMGRQARRQGFPPPDFVFDLVFVVLLSGFLGSRLLYTFQNWHEYAGRPYMLFAIWEGGLIYYGGVIFSIIAVWIFLRLRGISPLKGLDFVIPYVTLTHAFGRLGCFLNGCCKGDFCELPWAVRFPDDGGAARHPAQLYEAALNVLLFFFLRRRYDRKRFDGEVLGLYFMLYALIRFTVECVRQENPKAFGLTYNQWLSVAFFLAALPLYLFGTRAARKS